MTSQNPHHARRWAILAVLGIAQLMVVLDATIVNIALPSAQRALDFSDESRQWVVTAYALAFGCLLLLGGRIGDLFGRKRVFIAGLIGFAVASAHRRRRRVLRRARRLARPAGRLRRAARARRAVAADHDLHRPGRARQGVRHLRRDRRRRRRDRPAARRRADRVPVLALVPVREPAVRHPGRGRRVLAAGQPGPGRSSAARHPGHAHRDDRPVRARLRLLARRDRLLGRPADDRACWPRPPCC